MKHAMVAALAWLAVSGEAARGELLCPTQDVAAVDGRMLGHIRYDEARPTDLVAAPPGFAIGAPCRVRPEVAYDLGRMLAAADADPQVKGRLRAVSCYRSIAHQRQVFCSAIGPKKRARDAADRARFVGPPGYSEHATGYAIDFGTRPSRGCADVSSCFAGTAAGRWLMLHGPDYGFELSFPAGNAQSVSWEPWHWRWVGTSMLIPGASAARATFATARTIFPARPTTGDSAARALAPAPGFIMQR
ncbi:M15 family metallopeptidase [Sphingomonas sp.]|uniref:M15 family metallopeptidase n=1 Tax=Sphingomonas sp. TaxID=28214 RepID=UPI0025D1AF5C|nr:M15 family metallopeptidase [Sphingomonas sp.]